MNPHGAEGKGGRGEAKGGNTEVGMAEEDKIVR